MGEEVSGRGGGAKNTRAKVIHRQEKARLANVHTNAQGNTLHQI